MKKSLSNNKSTKLLAIGSVAFDSIETPFGKAKKTLGGSVTYFSLASSLFAPTAIIGVVGNDFNEFDVYRKRKIDITGLKKAKGKTFHWSGKYRFDMNTRDTLKTDLGVFAGFKPKLDDNHRAAKYIFLGNIQPKLQLDVLKQIKRPKLIGLDTMNLWIETARKDLLRVMRKIDILVINDGEARQLAKEHNLLKAARKILQMMNEKQRRRPSQREGRLLSRLLSGDKKILVIKQGEHGLMLFHRGMLFNLPGYPLENVADPTGAGDSFAGGFMGYLAKTDGLSFANLKKACAYGSVAASFTVENFGTKKLESLKYPQIQTRYKEYKNLTRFHA